MSQSEGTTPFAGCLLNGEECVLMYRGKRHARISVNNSAGFLYLKGMRGASYVRALIKDHGEPA